VVADDRLTLAEAAALTGLTQRALARRIERGSLPAAKNEEGRRTVTRRDLASAGLLDLATGKPPAWGRRGTPPADRLAQAILDELNARGVRIFELERGHEEQAEQIEELRRELREAKRERGELRSELGQASRERGELRREIEKLRGRLDT
jgi:DNA-binding transcriptional MerR regulator